MQIMRSTIRTILGTLLTALVILQGKLSKKL
nr:MAG TPA: hypothetical protein [Bacteriophage sp.]